MSTLYFRLKDKNSTNMTEAKIKELQLDVSELKLLQENATRNKVKDILSVQVRECIIVNCTMIECS